LSRHCVVMTSSWRH